MMTERKQLELNFVRGRKLRILDEVARRGALPPRMLLVLRAIDNVARNEPSATMSLSEIGDYSGQSRATAKRGVADLVQADLLIKTLVIGPSGKQANEYQIIWEYIQAIADGKPLKNPAPDPDNESSQVVKVATGQNEDDPGHSDPSDGSQRPPDPGHSDPSILYAQLRINPPPEINHRSWEGLEEILNSLGLAAGGKAISNAQANGCGPEDVARLVKFVRGKPGAYSPGFIFHRISQAQPGGDPSIGWPLESAEWLRSRQQAEHESQRNQAAQEADARRTELAKRKQSRQELESEYGAILDGMSDSERLALAKECGPTITALLSRDRNKYQSGGIRPFLLTELKKQETNQVQS